MLRNVSFTVAAAAALSLVTVASAAEVHAKRTVVRHSHGYGFLPGYRSPEQLERLQAPAPRYWYGGGLYYFGGPHFYRGRWNGGSFGPCWTQTPIGPKWTCG
jgi:hypothetical protein